MIKQRLTPILTHVTHGTNIIDTIIFEGKFYTRMIDYRTDQKTEIWFDLEDDLTPFLEDNPKYVTRGINSSRKSIVAYLKLVDETFFTTDHFTILEFIQESKKTNKYQVFDESFFSC